MSALVISGQEADLCTQRDKNLEILVCLIPQRVRCAAGDLARVQSSYPYICRADASDGRGSIAEPRWNSLPRTDGVAIRACCAGLSSPEPATHALGAHRDAFGLRTLPQRRTRPEAEQVSGQQRMGFSGTNTSLSCLQSRFSISNSRKN
jgi:hypothetical protein